MVARSSTSAGKMRGWSRAITARRLLYLACLISLNLSCTIRIKAAETSESDISLGSRNSIQADRSEIDLSSPDDGETIEEEENEIVGDEHLDSKFDWRHHKDDHSIYASRSLMSTANIKHHEHHNQDGEEEEEVEVERLKKLAGKSKDMNDDDPDPLKTIDYAEKEWQLMFRSLDSAYGSLSSSIIKEMAQQTNIFEEIVSRLPASCRRDIHYIRDSAKKHKLWALRMLDSNGKLPSGITYGRLSSPGDYEECLSVRVDDKLYTDVKNNVVENHKFHGKYCLLDFRLPLPEKPRNKLLSVHESVLNFTGTELDRLYPSMIKDYAPYASVFYDIGYMHAFCLPSTCEVTDLTRAMGKALEGMYLIVNNTVDCEERPSEPVPLRPSQWISLVLLTFIFLNAFAASIAHYLLPQETGKPDGHAAHSRKNASERKLEQAQSGLHETVNRLSQLKESKSLQVNSSTSLKQTLTALVIKNKFYSDCFSIQKNFERLTKPDPRGLTFVHYTRIVAMALTVITHTGALGTLQAITKPADTSNSEQIFRDLIPQMLANAFTSIQIFFFMAGFMLVLSTFPSIQRDKGHISFFEYAIKRAIRLLPGIIATICVNFIWPLLVDGPMLKYFDRMIVAPCETNWWHTLAFVSNFDHVEKMCLRHSYFSASDYQLHIIAFPLLILLYKQPSLSLFLATILTVSGFVAQIIMILTKTVLPFMMVDYIDKEAFFNVVHYIHHPVWNHMSAFFYGFIVGFLVVKQVRINLSETTIKRIWWVILPSGIASIFAPYFWNHYKRPIFKWQMVLYVIFDRFILLTTCAWLSYASMVLARKPPAKKTPAPQVNAEQPPKSVVFVSSPIKQALNKGQSANGATLTTSDQSQQGAMNTSFQTNLRINSSGSLASLPRQRSSPNLAYLQQQQQQQQQQLQQVDLGAMLGTDANIPDRLIRTVSSSNLTTIAEVNHPAKDQAVVSSSPQEVSDNNKAQPGPGNHREQQAARPRPQAPVSNINTLCLMLSRLTFQLYLFNMVVLWIDVNQSKYFWFFSYYFIVFKAAAIYICSAILAMIFFVVMESPSLSLYIAWVKGRAAARARSMRPRTLKEPEEVKIAAPPPITISTLGSGKDLRAADNVASPKLESVELKVANTKPAFSFIDLTSSPTGSESASPKGAQTQQQSTTPTTTTKLPVDQTRM